jgi:hypothetical protein
MNRRPRRNHTLAFIAIEHWPNWRSSSMSTPIRSHRGKRSWRAELSRNGTDRPAVDGKSLHPKSELTLQNDFFGRGAQRL